MLNFLASWVQVEGCFLPPPQTPPTSPRQAAAMQAAAATPPPLLICPQAAPSCPLPSPPPPTPCPHWQARYIALIYFPTLVCSCNVLCCTVGEPSATLASASVHRRTKCLLMSAACICWQKADVVNTRACWEMRLTINLGLSFLLLLN